MYRYKMLKLKLKSVVNKVIIETGFPGIPTIKKVMGAGGGGGGGRRLLDILAKEGIPCSRKCTY